MYIGKLAELTGASRKAIRLYESIGLIPTPKRKGNYRIYSDKDVMLITLIRRAQTIGFSLAEIKEFIATKAKSDQFPFELANQLINRKREKIKKEMMTLISLDKDLLELQHDLKQTFG